MPDKIRRILITGIPGSGKTILIKKLAEKLTVPFRGFFTNEIRDHGIRQGFEIESFSGKRAIMAHIDIDSPYKVSKYGVDVAAFEKIAFPEMENAIDEKPILVLDEIGKMELFSEKFREHLLEMFSADIKLVATIMYKPNPFCDKLKKMPGTKLYTISQGKIDILPEIQNNLL